jgi:protein-histidine N-methyltransferase
LGCGTAVPTLLLLDRLFASLASESGTGSAGVSETLETEIHLQDYNRAVLELVTFPNVLLAWCTFPSLLFNFHAQLFTTDKSPLSAPYRASAPDADSDSDSDDNAAPTSGEHERRPGALTVTPELLTAFTASLDAHRVRLRFFSGGWTSLRVLLTQSPSYDIVLASETIYRTDALSPFLRVLHAVMREAPHRTLCLVAAKVLYFGVGGGVQEFVRAVEDEGGTVHVVWEHREGVGRRIMRVEW